MNEKDIFGRCVDEDFFANVETLVIEGTKYIEKIGDKNQIYMKKVKEDFTNPEKYNDISFDSVFTNTIQDIQYDFFNYFANIKILRRQKNNFPKLENFSTGDYMTTIGNKVFYSLTNKQNLKNLTLGKSIKSIGDLSFWNNSLVTVNIPDSTTYLGLGSFAYNSIVSLTLGNSIKIIGENSFYQNKLASINIPNSVEIIGASSFSSNLLSTLTIPNSVKMIDIAAFATNLLTSINLGTSITTIGINAFSDNKLTSIIIPNSVVTISEAAFISNGLTSLVIPNSTTTIESYSFAFNKLTSLTLGNSVTTIGESSFYENLLTSNPLVIIPNSVISIGDIAFGYNDFDKKKLPDITHVPEKGRGKDIFLPRL